MANSHDPQRERCWTLRLGEDLPVCTSGLVGILQADHHGRRKGGWRER